MNSTLSLRLDKAAIGLSTLCAVHCLLLPVALTLLPSLTASLFADESFHYWMLVAVLPTSVIALTLGCRKHRNISVVALGLAGVAIMFVAAFYGHDLLHDYLGENGERVGTVVGASLVALSHWRNHQLCKLNQNCC